GVMCSMASFKNHCAFGFWKASLMADSHKLMSGTGETAMGQFGKITDIADLPEDNILIDYVKEAAKLNDDRVKLPAKPKKAKKELEIPADFMQAMSKNKKALATFESFSYTNKKEYVEWITEAKQEATRKRRLATAVQWLSEGKIRNWKYVKK
ncbi:MAG: YdeI family protein, partial [bacterium]